MSAEEAQVAEAVKEEVKPAATEDEEDVFGDDDDLFAEDEDPDAAAAAAALKEKLYLEAKKRGEEKLQKSKSLIVLEIKPFEADFDLEQLAQGIKAMTHEGIQNWGEQHKLEPVAFGIKKLIISLVVHDTKVSVDDITDMINEKYEDDIQSIDVQSMSKV